MEKTQVETLERSNRDGSITSTLDQEVLDPSNVSTAEKTEVTVLEETSEETIKRKKKEKMGRILTFIGLQIALFLAALDG